MNKKFQLLSVQDETLLTKEDAIKYYEEKVCYYKKAPINLAYLMFVRIIRKPLIKIASKTSDYELVYLNKLDAPENGYIIATNHKGFNDLPILLEAVQVPFHFLAANDVPMPINIKIIFKLLGAIPFSRKNKKEKQWGLDRLSKICARGFHGAVYPEAVNNFTDSLPLYPFWSGIIDIAKNSGKPILPVVTHDVENKVYVKYGKPVKIDVWENRDDAAMTLRDTMATLLWEIWETFPVVSREDVIAAYIPPNLTRGDITFIPEYETQYVYRPVNPHSPDGERIVTWEEVLGAKANRTGEK